MFTAFARFAKSASSLALLSLCSASYLHFQYNNKKESQKLITCLTYPFSILSSQTVECMQAVRANKPQLIKLVNSAKQQILLLIYNKQSEQQLRNQILQFCSIARKLNISKVVLVDQTDVRHLQTFARLLQENIQDDEDKQLKDKSKGKRKQNKQPIDLQGNINVLYIHPTYNTNKPFSIQSLQTLAQQVTQIRSYLRENPSISQLKASLGTFNKTTVIKNCYNQTCVEQYKQKIRQLIGLQLLRGKIENYGFYVTSTKAQANKIAQIIGQTSNKQQIYVFRNDLLGQSRDLNSQFEEKEGKKYENANKFMMLIRPRVHLIGKKNTTTDLFWYVTSARVSGVFTFAINNTNRNLPVRILNNSYINNKSSQDSNKTQQKTSQNNNQKIIYIKGHYKQRELLRRIKQKYGNKVEVMVLQTNTPSQLFRHLYCPQRYSIFKLTPQLPYPKLLIKPPIINMDMEVWDSTNFKMRSEEQIGKSGNVNEIELGGDNGDCDEKWNQVLRRVDAFLKKPISYNNVKMYREKQLQINAEDLANMMNGKEMPYNKGKWVFRVCGPINSCLYSVYQKYGMDLSVPVYWLDGQVQNVAVQQADYQVENGQVTLLS